MLRFGPWLPDQPVTMQDIALVADNVIPHEAGYQPFKQCVPFTAALAAAPLGAKTFVSLGGAVYNFVGTATKLYRLDTATNTFTDYTRASGGNYAVGAGNYWSFAQFDNYVYAQNGSDTPQRIVLDIDTKFSNFAAMPIGKYLFTTRGFLGVANLASNPRGVEWSAINDSTSWTHDVTTLCDGSTIRDGGDITGATSGEIILLFQRTAYNRMTFAGPPGVFSLERISSEQGCIIPGSIAYYGDLVFFRSTSGFKMLQGGQNTSDIGEDKVDRYFERTFGSADFGRANSSIDKKNELYILNLASPNASPTGCDIMLVYHWSTGIWARVVLNTYLLTNASSEVGYTLETIDALASSLDAMDFSFDSDVFNAAGIIDLAAFLLDSPNDKKLGFFNGDPMAMAVSTGDIQLIPGRKSMLRSIRPIIEGTISDAFLTPYGRDRLQDSIETYPTAMINRNGLAPMRVNARYHRLRMDTSAGGDWKFALGLDEPRVSQMAR